MNAKHLSLKFSVVGLLVMVCLWSLLWGSGLREGIDIRGGHSLIFEIRSNQADIDRLDEQIESLKASLNETSDEAEKQGISERIERAETELNRYSVGDPGDLAQQMIRILKDRVDPRGLESLEWRPLGTYRIEVRMPAGQPKSNEKRVAYMRALDEIENNNIQQSEIRSVLLAPAAQRAEKIETLALGEAEQTRRFNELVAAYDQMKAAEQALAKAPGEQTRNAYEDSQVLYEDKFRALRKGNISRLRMQSVLDRYVSAGEAEGKGGELKRRRNLYAAQLNELRDNHAARLEEINSVVGFYEDWANIRRRLDAPADLQRLIAKAGVLEFRIAPFDIGSNRDPAQTINPEKKAEFREILQTEGPEGLKKRNEEYLWFPIQGPRKDFPDLVVDNYAGKDYVLLYNQRGFVMLRETREDMAPWKLDKAEATFDQSGRPAVGFGLNEPGARRFSRLTSDNLKRPMAILLDDEAFSAPIINDVISREGIITGSFSQEEVGELVRTLVAGSLPARLNPEPVSVNTFGPSIGKVNRDKGIRAAFWGLIAVAAFMLFYYRLPGIIAVVALLLNVILVLGTMSLIKAVFTLPGIAGVILTIGIAVDANVLIFERLREEQAKGQSVRQALKNAYERAFSAIFDANVTTLLVCLILGWVGTEEVRGFAITLGLGVMFSLFTALIVTRWIFQVLLDIRLVKKPLRMMRLIGVPKINWMQKRYFFWAITTVFIVVGVVSLIGQGSDIWGIEFSSGTKAVVTFRPDALIEGKLADDEKVRNEFKAAAGELGYDKLAATALVEMRINPDAVREFMRDYDDKENPDGEVSLAEWEAHGLRKEFFKQIDLGGDGVITAEEVSENLPPRSFQISTTVVQLSQITESARKAFGTDLQIRLHRDYRQVKDELVAELGVKIPSDGWLRITPQVRRQIKPTYRDEFLDYEGGALRVLRDIEPAISKTELEQRIRDMRLQPDFKDQSLSPTQILSLGAGANEEHTSYAVLVRPAEMSIVERVGAWETFMEGENELLVAALKRQESMIATNFDPAIAGETAQLAIVAVILSWAAIVAYLWLRFGSVQWGLAAVICLIHDVIIVVGLVAVTGWIHNRWLGQVLGIGSFKIDLAMVAAILTVIGYSVNDTIVVFDRIRENRGKLVTVSGAVINASINQTLARTLLTSGTTFVVVVIMYVIGGAGVHAFSFALLAGILFGTYSSVAVASPLLMGFKKALVAKVTSSAVESD